MAKAKLVSSGGAGLRKLAADMELLSKHAVSVGIHQSAGFRSNDPDVDVGEEDMIDRWSGKEIRELYAGKQVHNAQVGAWNEYGTERIPERSFIRSTIDENNKSYQASLRRIVKKILSGDQNGHKMMGRLGMKIQNQVQAKIVSIQEPPNAESTIKRKKSSKPLVDSGQLSQSIKWEYLNVGDVD